MTRNVEEIDGDDDNEEDLIRFPIEDTDGSVHMKNIPPSFSSKISWSKVGGSKNLSL